MSDEEPKIIVDEDWKDQVQREKDQLREQEQAAAADPADQGAGGPHEMPPASMPFLISMLSSQAMMGMGFMPDPSGQPAQVDLPMAKHFIDLLSVLEEKTKGNLTDEEEKMLTESLHQFRMAYVQMSTGEAAAPEATDESTGSQIELP